MSRPKKRGGRFTPPKLTRRGKVRRLIAEAKARLEASPTGTIAVPPTHGNLIPLSTEDEQTLDALTQRQEQMP